ncbi:coiled-coil domain-containing protein [Paenibacillus sp. TAF58]
MTYKFVAIILSILLLTQITLPLQPISAEEKTSTQDEAKDLVQKGLTIFEIDKEVSRLNEQDASIVAQIKQNEQDIIKQKSNVENTRKHAGKVLRAYYTGDRDSIWMLLFTVSSFTDALRMFEYMQMIITNDHRALSAFTESFKKLTNLRTELDSSRAELQKTKEKFLTQRERLVKLQEELDKQLAVSTQAQVIEDQIKSLNDQWRQEGIPLFREYLNSLSSAFRELPQYVTKESKFMDLSSIKNPVITISDKDFNTYLHSKNELLQNLNFEFTDGSIIAKGNKDHVQIRLQGMFILKELPDMNEVRFIVDKLEFNGFQLPDTTIEDFMKEFQLGFTPKKIVNYLDVVSVETKNGIAVVKLKLSL